MNSFIDIFQHSFDYLAWIVQARRTIYQQDVDASPRLTRSYSFASANVGRLLPEISRKEHLDFAREVKWHQMWAAHDQRCFDLVGGTRIVDDERALAPVREGSGAIFCTFHVGSYRLVNSMLHALDLDYFLIADGDFVEHQGPHVRELSERLQREYLNQEPRPFEIVNAETPTGALKALRNLKRGRSALVYIDGNTGVGGPGSNRAHYVPVSFFGNSLFARRGVAFLSYTANVPIIPVVCVRTDWLSRELRILDPITPVGYTDRDVYCTEATQQLFGILEREVRRSPAEWEGWLYVHKFLDLSQEAHPVPIELSPEAGDAQAPFDPERLFRFNDRCFSMFPLAGEMILFDRDNFISYPVSEEFRTVIDTFRSPTRARDLTVDSMIVRENAIAELYRQGVLIYHEDEEEKSRGMNAKAQRGGA